MAVSSTYNIGAERAKGLDVVGEQRGNNFGDCDGCGRVRFFLGFRGCKECDQEDDNEKNGAEVFFGNDVKSGRETEIVGIRASEEGGRRGSMS